MENKNKNTADPKQALIFRLIASGLVLYWLLQIVRDYMAGGPEAPSTLLLVIACVFMGGGAVLIALLSIRTWKKAKEEQKNEEE